MYSILASILFSKKKKKIKNENTLRKKLLDILLMTQKVGSDNSDDFDEEEIKDNVFRKTNFSKCIFLGRMFETVF